MAARQAPEMPETEEDTLEPSRRPPLEHEILQPQITILWHPDRHLIGATAPVLWNSAGAFELSRWAPLFQHRNEAGSSLGDRRISRSPLLLKRQPQGAISLEPPSASMAVEINGSTAKCTVSLSRDSLRSGATICLSRRVGLCLHLSPPRGQREDDRLGLVGSSRCMAQLRQQIRQVAPTNASVLIRGETGTGKELVARAVHSLSRRAEREMVSINMATLGGELAAAELFGARQGAYTGARNNRPGLIREAHGSTFFMDEIGDTSPSVQVMLLRVLEEGRLRSLGDSRDQPVDVRFVAATDRALEADAERPFNQPLRRRLETFVLQLPALRERREDFGELFLAFLTEAENEFDRALRVPADLVCTLAAGDWPGNVRELRNLVTRLAINAGADGELPWNGFPADHYHPATAETAAPSAPRPRGPRYRDPATVNDSDLLRAMNENSWRVMPAARALGVSRTSMYALLEQSDTIRQTQQISGDEIRETMRQGPDLDAWAAQLRTPREALKRRIGEMEPGGES
ncbi:sigma 54-interacting transcriptional regulator [Microbulbifer litoralis]|uniref:sigma 54-interacting transcriptional regulator n=1 Tax=Microbulbifer litoralis TaxID=2933965 RepID=UPI002028FF4A|nr:sigma 54-interacting transcriptional regulator [Microbulbifer sp. GX H0434]